MNHLEKIIERTREDVARRAKQVAYAELERLAAERSEPRGFNEALLRPGVAVIAEHKRRSPSAGRIREDLEVEDIVGAYEEGGASAISVLTDEAHFGGSLADLRRAKAAVDLPILRKDFIVDPYQVVESAAWEADAILLIVAALEPLALAELHAQARELDLDVLVEVHGPEELEAALEVMDPDIIGINNRDLTDMTVDIARTHDLLVDVPAGKTVVAESGFYHREQIDELERVGCDAVLIGEALMRSEDLSVATRVLAGPEDEAHH
ncbi:MAG: indole-3-glycerol phosphate synthase TrpC [Solirubrobacteraceae bacterium]|nr:indole-3-glycerol phosphate synthase TrpC [Solirubrobacteraceae bacterium]